MSKNRTKQETQEYARYIHAYNNKVNQLVRQGLSTANVQPRLNFIEWKTTYNATRNQLESEVVLQKATKVGDINTAMVDRQIFKYSDKQARAMQVAAERTGQNLSLAEIRTGKFDWTRVKDYYKDLIQQGIDPTEASHMVSQYFFGSK